MTERLQSQPVQAGRLEHLDILRTVAFLSVILHHLLGSWGAREASMLSLKQLTLTSVVFELTRCCTVPVFVFLSALLMFRRRTLDYPRHLKKQFFRIWLPFALWSGVYLYYYGKLTVGNYLLSLVTGNACAHLWFVVMILQFAILAPLLRKGWAFAERLCGKNLFFRILAFGIPFALALFWLYITTYPTGIPAVDAVFFYRRSLVGFTFFGFYLLGAFVGSHYEWSMTQLRKWPVWGSLLLLWCVGTAFALVKDIRTVAATNAAYFSGSSYVIPKGALVCMAGVLLLMLVCEKLAACSLLKKVCAVMGELSYDGYLSHMLFMSLISLLMLKLLPGISLLVFYPVLMVLTTVTALIFAAGMKKLRGLWSKTGKSLLDSIRAK